LRAQLDDELAEGTRSALGGRRIQWQSQGTAPTTERATTLSTVHGSENLAVEERLAALLTHLGIQRVHVAAGFVPNAATLAMNRPEIVASVTLICPFRMPREPFMPAGVPLLMVYGINSLTSLFRELAARFPDTRTFELQDYDGAAWSDVMADRGADIAPTLFGFLSEAEQQIAIQPADIPEADGEVAGITYQIRGSGPPVLLLPLSLARSQWEPFVPVLARHYTTVVVGGAHLGVVPILEDRMQGGYRGIVRSVVDAAQPHREEAVLEVGCGPGSVARWLVGHVSLDSPLTAVDVNSYLLREAAALTKAEGLDGRIEFQEGDAEALPFASESFDVTLSFTVMEEVDADRMLAEMLRVTRRGGRVGVVVRATDQPRFLNISLSPELDAKVLAMSAPRAGVASRGCADVSLYRRFVDAGLVDLQMGPQLAPDTLERSASRDLPQYVNLMTRLLTRDEGTQFRDAIARAEQDRTLIFAEPYHCAVGVRR
jgi:SAM-dependent methyltransferase